MADLDDLLEQMKPENQLAAAVAARNWTVVAGIARHLQRLDHGANTPPSSVPVIEAAETIVFHLEMAMGSLANPSADPAYWGAAVKRCAVAMFDLDDLVRTVDDTITRAQRHQSVDRVLATLRLFYPDVKFSARLVEAAIAAWPNKAGFKGGSYAAAVWDLVRDAGDPIASPEAVRKRILERPK